MKINISSNKKDLIMIPIFFEKKKTGFFSEMKNEKIILEKIKLFKFKAENEKLLRIEIKTSQTPRVSEGLGIISQKNSLNQKFLLVGIKKNYKLEDLRKVYSLVFDYLKSKKENNVLIEIPNEKEDEIKAIIEGLDLTDYNFDKYLSKKEKFELNVNLNVSKKFQGVVKKTLLINNNVKFVRNLVMENADIITPIFFEKMAKNFAKKNKLKIKILNEKQIIKEKLNLLNAVGQGSINPPRLIIVEYNENSKSKEKIALVGKGITFDTGGINLKPSGHIEDMKTDMAGAATTFGAFKSLVELKVKKNLILVLSCAENSISSKSYKPGDIFVGYNEVSVEIENTDAEGRLVLADALAYVSKNYKPTQILDMATLTGSCLVAMGPTLIAMLGNDKKINQKIFEIGERTFERVWEMPIYDEHRDLIKGKFSDIKNTGGREGGTITATAFLEKFIGKNIKWTHFDIAGAARSHAKKYYVPEYGTGVGVRLLVDYLST